MAIVEPSFVLWNGESCSSSLVKNPDSRIYFVLKNTGMFFFKFYLGNLPVRLNSFETIITWSVQWQCHARGKIFSQLKSLVRIIFARRIQQGGKMYCTLDRKDICLAYEKVKIVPWQTTLLWGREAVIVSKVNSFFCWLTGGVHLSLQLCLKIKEN